MTQVSMLIYTIVVSFVLCTQVWYYMQSVNAIDVANETSKLYGDYLRNCVNFNTSTQISHALLWTEQAKRFSAGALPASIWLNNTCTSQVPLHWVRVRQKIKKTSQRLNLLTVCISLHVLQLGCIQGLLYSVEILKLEGLKCKAILAHIMVSTCVVLCFLIQALQSNDGWHWLWVACGIIFLVCHIAYVPYFFFMNILAAVIFTLAAIQFQVPAISAVFVLLLIPWNHHGILSNTNSQKIPIYWRRSTLSVVQENYQVAKIITDPILEQKWCRAGYPDLWVFDDDNYVPGTVCILKNGVLIAIKS